MKIKHLPAIAITLSVAALAALAAAPLRAESTTQPGESKASSVDVAPVTAKLIADTAAIEPGKPFHLAVLLDIKPGFHVYWKNPGDAGLPTSVNFSLPDGMAAVGSLQWPRPTTFHQAGNITGYGYTDSVLLNITVNASDCLPVGSTATLRADVSWLACQTDDPGMGCPAQCIPGQANLELSLPVADKARPANTQLFAEWNGRTNPPAPAFTLKDQDGATVQLADFAGKIVVLEWLNPDCPFVKYHYQPDVMTMAKLAATYSSKGVVWLAINSTRTMDAARDKAFRDQNHLPYAVLDDHQGDVGRAYQAKSTPHLFVIDADGNIAYQGAIDNAPLGKLPADAKLTNYVQQALDDLLANQPVGTPQTKSYGCSVKYAK